MTTQYERLKEMSQATRDRTRGGQVVVHTKDIEWEAGPGGHRRRAFISEPDILGSMVQTMAAFLSEMPPGGRSGKHRHFNEAMIFVLKGRGHTIIGDGAGEKRYEWGEGDLVSVPVNEWHQHFNDDPKAPALHLGITNLPLLRAMGLNSLEDAAS